MSKPCLLVVDDETDSRRTLHAFAQCILPRVEVVSVASAQAALAILRRQRVDAILSDLHMPGMDGIELLRHSADLQPHAARMLCTGDDPEPWAAYAVNGSHVSHLFAKPIDPTRLAEALATFFAAWTSSK